jgi:hypothetical protein
LYWRVPVCWLSVMTLISQLTPSCLQL